MSKAPELEPEPDPADFEVPPGADSEAKDPRQGYAFSPLVTQRCCIYIDNDEDYQRASQILVKNQQLACTVSSMSTRRVLLLGNAFAAIDRPMDGRRRGGRVDCLLAMLSLSFGM